MNRFERTSKPVGKFDSVFNKIENDLPFSKEDLSVITKNKLDARDDFIEAISLEQIEQIKTYIGSEEDLASESLEEDVEPVEEYSKSRSSDKFKNSISSGFGDSRDLGSKIRELRERKGLTQEELANALGYDSPAIISKLESGMRELTLRRAVELCEYFGISLDAFVRVSPNKNKKKKSESYKYNSHTDYLEERRFLPVYIDNFYDELDEGLPFGNNEFAYFVKEYIPKAENTEDLENLSFKQFAQFLGNTRVNFIYDTKGDIAMLIDYLRKKLSSGDMDTLNLIKNLATVVYKD